jgi:hypothetical protein
MAEHHVTAARNKRLARYAELRDQGIDSYDAAREVGLTGETARSRYERWYRSVRGQPPRRRGWPWRVAS